MSSKKAAAKTAAVKTVGRAEDEFEREYDKDYKIPNAIRAGLKRLGSRWMRNLDFAKHCGINPVDLNAYADQFGEHIVQEPGNRRVYIWWGSVEKAQFWRDKFGQETIGVKHVAEVSG